VRAEWCSEWFRMYRGRPPDGVVADDGVGSGEGIRRFIGRDVGDDERVDFGASDAAMRDDEIAAVPTGAVLVPLTAGSVALAYNLPNLRGGVRLPGEAYVGIFLRTLPTWKRRGHPRPHPYV